MRIASPSRRFFRIVPAAASAADSPVALPPRQLAELAALGEEAAAFAAAGLPLEVGLGAGAPSGLSERVARNLRAGMSLPDAYAAERGPLPAAMQAVLESGVRSGRPAEALARVAERSRSVSDLRTELAAAAIGPLTVVAAVAALTAWLLPAVAGRLADTIRQAGGEVSASVRLFEWIGELDGLWRLPAPIVAVGLVLLIGRLTGWRALTWLPGVRGVRNELRQAGVAHLLSLLTEAGVPLGEALRLSAGAAGNSGRARLAAAADRIDAGEDRSDVFAAGRGSAAPPAAPLIAWTLATVPATDLPATLAEASAYHGRRARAKAGRVAAAWPLAATALAGGLAALAYVFGVALPAVELLETLSRPLTWGAER